MQKKNLPLFVNASSNRIESLNVNGTHMDFVSLIFV